MISSNLSLASSGRSSAHRLGIDFDALAAVLAGVGGSLVLDHLQQGLAGRQLRPVAHRVRLQVLGQLDLVADQHQHVRQAVAALQDVADLAQGAGVLEVGREVEQQEHAALVVAVDRLQGGAGVGGDIGLVLAIHVDPAHALGDRPAEQGAPDVHQRLAEQFHHPGLVRGLDHDEGGVGANQRHEVLQAVHAVLVVPA